MGLEETNNLLRYVGQGNLLQQHVSNRAYDMDIIQFKNKLNFEITDDNDLMQKLRKFYTTDGYTPEITIDREIIHIKIDEKVFRTVQRNFEKAMDLCKRHEFDATLDNRVTLSMNSTIN